MKHIGWKLLLCACLGTSSAVFADDDLPGYRELPETTLTAQVPIHTMIIPQNDLLIPAYSNRVVLSENRAVGSAYVLLYESDDIERVLKAGTKLQVEKVAVEPNGFCGERVHLVALSASGYAFHLVSVKTGSYEASTPEGSSCIANIRSFYDNSSVRFRFLAPPPEPIH